MGFSADGVCTPPLLLVGQVCVQLLAYFLYLSCRENNLKFQTFSLFLMLLTIQYFFSFVDFLFIENVAYMNIKYLNSLSTFVSSIPFIGISTVFSEKYIGTQINTFNCIFLVFDFLPLS